MFPSTSKVPKQDKQPFLFFSRDCSYLRRSKDILRPAPGNIERAGIG